MVLYCFFNLLILHILQTNDITLLHLLIKLILQTRFYIALFHRLIIKILITNNTILLYFKKCSPRIRMLTKVLTKSKNVDLRNSSKVRMLTQSTHQE